MPLLYLPTDVTSAEDRLSSRAASKPLSDSCAEPSAEYLSREYERMSYHKENKTKWVGKGSHSHMVKQCMHTNVHTQTHTLARTHTHALAHTHTNEHMTTGKKENHPGQN